MSMTCNIADVIPMGRLICYAYNTALYLSGDKSPHIYKYMYRFWQLLYAMEVCAPYRQVVRMLRTVKDMVDASCSTEEIEKTIVDWLMNEADRGYVI